ncbi:hypothetical protein [Nonomuraea candida]|uniref:hypothetical protein n=1 Tax=Nonomuraea candida TaxID=359159 RepID=UPI0005B80F00|nr:hypothetical protein [Nonomuraea candida]
MARVRQRKKGSSSQARGGDPPEPGPGAWKAARTWVAGVASAVLVAAAGVVFTAWYTASGTDAVDQIGGKPPLTVGHVEVDLDERPLVLRGGQTKYERKGQCPALPERALISGYGDGA